MIMYFHIHFMILLTFFIPSIQLCGPQSMGGRRGRYPVKAWLKPGEHLPKGTTEMSMFGSGKQEEDKSSCSYMSQILSTDIVFEDPTFHSESRYATKACKSALLRLLKEMKHLWRDSFKLYVIKGYTTSKTEDGLTKMHKEGRAFDISVVFTTDRKKPIPNHILPRLAHMAFHNAKFNFVKYTEYGYLHVSCVCKDEKIESRCFPGDSLVRMENGERKFLSDVKPGDMVMTMNDQGVPIFDEVIMLMHRNQNEVIDDYVKVTTYDNKTLTLSRLHLVLLHNGNTKFAKDLLNNDILSTYDPMNSKMRISSVRSLKYITKTGMYAPLTRSGTIIVDDVYVSCYTLFPSQRISHAVFWVWRQFYHVFKRLDDSAGFTDGNIHWYPKLFKDGLDWFNIFHYII